MASEFKVDGELESKFSTLLTNLNSEATTPWSKKPASRLAILAFLVSFSGFLVSLVKLDTAKKESDRLHKENTLARIDLNERGVELQDRQRLLDIANQKLEVKRQERGEVSQQVLDLEADLGKVKTKFGALADYVIDGQLTHYTVLDSLTPGILVTENPTAWGFDFWGKYTVSAFLDYPLRFEQEILSLVESVVPVHDTFLLSDGSVLNLGDGVSIQSNEVLPGKYKKRWNMYYWGDRPIESFTVQVELKVTPDSKETVCYELTYPSQPIDADNLPECPSSN